MPRLCKESSRSYPGRSVHRAAIIATGVGLRPTMKALELPPNPMVIMAAHHVVTHGVSGQKSAEVIVAQCLG
jgi:hypothetical protein